MPPGPDGIRQAFRLSAAGAVARAGSAAQAESAAMATRSPARKTATKTSKSASTTKRPSPGKTTARQAKAGASTPVPEQGIERVDTSYLESLIGYNARRAALAVIAVFLERMAPHGLRPVDFSTLSLITHNPGITARQLCNTLGILPPNMVGMINGFEKRGLIERRPHPTDRRAQGLHLTTAGARLMKSAEKSAAELEQEVAHRLSPQQQKTLMGLLQKIYL